MRSTFTFGRIAGIQIGIHYTWVFAFGLVSWSLAAGLFPENLPGQTWLVYGLMGMAGALSLFGSVLVHELSHSLVARMRGLHVNSITLFIFGGVSNLAGEAARPRDELLIALVGPATSLGVAGLCWVLGQARPGSATIAGALLDYIRLANLVLGLFNLVPGFPLDGGRILRSVVWALTGSLRRATRIASYAGQAVGFAMMFWGLMNVLDGNVLSGIWIAFIGWFLSGAAESTRQDQSLQEALGALSVSSIMDPRPPVADPAISVETFVFDHALQRSQRAVLIVEDGYLRGIVSLTDAKRVPRRAWPTTSLADVMTTAPLAVLSPESTVATALEQMAHHSIHQLPVVVRGRVVGLVSRGDILRVLQLQQELALPPDVQPASRQSALRRQAPDRAGESDTADAILFGPRR
jgi:Zn-dependent protease/CBS domain-containing protein